MAARGRKESPSMTMMNEAKEKGVLEVTCKKTYIEMTCGCTDSRFGDVVGILRIFTSGQFLIICQCNDEHKEGKMSPGEFEKHALNAARDWKNRIWVMLESSKIPKRLRCEDEEVSKVSLRRAGLLKFYKHGSNLPSRGLVRRRWNFHRDEFVRCTRCLKLRRFLLRSKEQCKLYHDALSSKRWKCRDHPFLPIRCEDDEERESRMGSRGCLKGQACKGCTSCVCFGCLMCRFPNCDCQSCLDFMQNAPP